MLGKRRPSLSAWSGAASRAGHRTDGRRGAGWAKTIVRRRDRHHRTLCCLWDRPPQLAPGGWGAVSSRACRRGPDPEATRSILSLFAARQGPDLVEMRVSADRLSDRDSRATRPAESKEKSGAKKSARSWERASEGLGGQGFRDRGRIEPSSMIMILLSIAAAA